jgi:predicted dehydrogenase
MAMNTQEAEEMLKVSKETGSLLMLGFVRRFGNDADLIRKFIANGTLGDLYYAKACYLRRNGCPGGWFGDKEYSGGGPLIDLGVHIIDLVRFLAGNPTPIAAYGVTDNSLGTNRASGGQEWVSTTKGDFKYNVEDFASAMIRFDNGLTLHIEASFNLNIKNDKGETEIFGTKAGVKISPDVEFFGDMNGVFVDIKPFGNTALDINGLFEKEVGHFVDCALGNAECISTAEDGVMLMRILDAIYESARTGHEVAIKA